jgi:ribosomal protein S20
MMKRRIEASARRNQRNRQEETMRRFMVHLVTEVEFEDGDEASDKAVQNYQKHLKETVQTAAQGLFAPDSQGCPDRERLGRRN